MQEKQGHKYGLHRVIEPEGVLPQPAIRVNNNMEELYDNEILCDVQTLNVDSASFTQIKQQAEGDVEKIKEIMLGIVEQYGKHKNPVTGSGGMFIGTVKRVGSAIKDTIGLKEGDRIASLVSLSLTPLRIDEIVEVHADHDQVDIKGQAILFESAIWAKLPDDMSDKLALAVLDVAGAAAQTANLVKPGDSVLIIGAAGKSGLLCAYEAKKRCGVSGKVIGTKYSPRGAEVITEAPFVDEVIYADASKAVDMMEKTMAANNGKLVDVVINCVNNPDCEMGSILPVRDGGIVYFFSMATSFTKAALGAEGIGKDVTMLIGNGYAPNHAEWTLEMIRESEYIRKIYEERY